MGSNKASLDFFDVGTGKYQRNIYPTRNPGIVKELGDVGNDIAIYGSKLYAVINCSHYVEVMDVHTGRHVGSIDVLNCRYIVFHDGKAYISSYAGPVQIDPNARPGKVVEVDTTSLKITREVVVGYQPEEMVITGGKLYVANSGGYRYPNYDTTVSVVDLRTFAVDHTIDVAINLHRMALDRYGRIYVSSRGDYYDVKADVYVVDTQTDRVTRRLDIPASEMCLVGDSLYMTAVEWSYVTQSNTVSYTLYDVGRQEVVTRNFITDGTGSTSLGQLPVLTLPGIAGLVLSVGMAVDANVLIFERMREEFRLGKTAKAAVAAGYERAFLAIFDSNLTTLITGVILFIFGSGPIRGFAVTLCGGIIISMFTALVVTRLIFNLIVQDTTKPYKMLQWVPETINFDFLRWAKPLAFAALAVIVVTVGLFLFRATKNPSSVMAVDFTGGLSLLYEATLKSDGSNVALDPDQVRAIVDGIEGISDPTVQNATAENGKIQTLVKTAVTEVKGKDGQTIASEEAIRRAIDEATPDYNVVMVSRDQVGSQIGSELKRDAVWSIALSLIMIIAYVSFRFQFGFALGGVVALAHDALITLGVYTLCGNQVSLTTVAALLTIVGYSINDTIVAYDRVREIMAREPDLDFPTAIRKGLNQTLSRTLLTTLSTLMPVAALYFFGGAAMHDFAFALFVGMVAGTYSTLFIAPLVTVAWYRGKRPLTAEQRAAARAAKLAAKP